MVSDRDNADSSLQFPQHRPDRLDEELGGQLTHANLSWFKRPSLTWIFCMKCLSSIAVFVTAGPRVEIYTELICRGYTPSRLEAPPFISLPVAVISPSVLNSMCPAQSRSQLHGQTFMTVLDTPSFITGAHSSMMTGGCVSDPHIQVEIPRLSLVIAVVGGILSCLTTGWWGGFLDRHGRTHTMGIIIFGLLLADFFTFIVFYFSDILPGKYWLLVLSAFMEGMVGAPSSVMAAEMSYMRDVSEPSDLAQNFSLLIGLHYAGGTIGPALGGFLNHQTGSVMAAFYGAAVVHLTYALLAWFAMPESISKAAIIDARSRYSNALASVASTDASLVWRQVMFIAKSFWDSFPLNVLAPKSTQNTRQKDWNLVWLAISAGLINAVMGSGSSLYQYALYTFSWTSLELGYFISASGLSTVIFLMMILPAIIRVWRRVLPCARHAEEAMQSMSFNLLLIKASCILFVTGYALMGVSSTGLIFTLCSIISTFGHGFLPALQSVAVILYAGNSGADTGRLFGALGVVARIVGPAIYGAMYAVTVSFMPAAVLWLSVGCAMIAFLVLTLVRLPDHLPGTGDGAEQQRADPTDNVPGELDPLLEPNGV